MPAPEAAAPQISAPDPYGYVDPAWAPPAADPDRPHRQRPGWLPLLVVSLVTALVAGGLFAAERVGASTGASAATAYLPVDGQADFFVRSTGIGDQSTTSTLVTESALQTGGLVIGGLDWTLGVAVLGVVGGTDHLDRMRFWRTTTTEIGNLGNSQQHIRVYRVDGPVELLAESDAGGADVYRPGLVELPADVAAGDSWSGQGTVGARQYQSSFRADPAEPGCLRVSGTIVESAAGQPGSTREVHKTWCQGRGVTVEDRVRGDVRTQIASTPRPAVDPTLRTVTDEPTWSDPTSWRRRDFDLMSADASLGSGPMAGTPSQVPPVLTASSLLIRPTSGDDLVATTPKTVDRWTSLWRMHPGGTILTAAAFGDVVVVTTSRREVVAYSDAGVRLWTVAADDVPFRAPVRVDAGRIAVADAAGGVRVIELLTGREVWRQRVRGQPSAAPVGDPRAVVVFDARGTTTAFAADTGERIWTKDLNGERGAVLGTTLVVRNAATLEALDLQTGRHRWLLPQTGTLDALVPFGNTLVAASQLGTHVIEESGAVRGKLPAYEWVTVVGDTMVGWGATTAEFRGADLTLITRLDTPDLTLSSSRLPPLAYRQGVIGFGRTWTFSTWSDEP